MHDLSYKQWHPLLFMLLFTERLDQPVLEYVLELIQIDLELIDSESLNGLRIIKYCFIQFYLLSRSLNSSRKTTLGPAPPDLATIS